MRAHVAADHHVLDGRHLGEQPDVLEGARDARLRDLVHRGRLVRRAAQHEGAAVGRVQAGDDVEEGGLAGAVGADQAVDLARIDGDADVGQGLQAAEALGHAIDLENCVAHGVEIPLVLTWQEWRSARPCRARAMATGRAGAGA